MALSRLRDTRVALVCASVYAAAYLAVLVLDTGSRLAVVVDDVGNLLSPTVAAVACAFAARRCTGRLRLSWTLFAAFAGVWALGQLAWCWYEVVRDTAVPFPGLPDVGYVASVPFVVAALLVHPDAPRFASGALRVTSDAVIVAGSLLALSWRLALDEAYGDGVHGFATLLGLAYPVLDVVVLTLLLLVGSRARGRQNRPFLWVAACLAAGALGHSVYGVLATAGEWQPGNPVDAAWGVGFLFLALGAGSERGTERERVIEGMAPARSALLPYVPLLVLLALALVDQVRGQSPDSAQRAFAAVVFVGVLARQALAVLENSRLSRGLEEVVAARTLELFQSTERLKDQAFHDSLTGLPNRALLFDRIDAALAEGPVLVALLDLDGFKGVNDSLGHAAGDELLDIVGRLLARRLPPEVLAARLGGDEFAFLWAGVHDEQQARAFGGQVLRSLSGPVELGSRTLTLTGSLGLVLSSPTDTAESLLRNADVAMYAAKDAGKDRVRMFEPAMRDALLERVAMEADLRVALLAGEVSPWFQPVVDLGTGHVLGVEALARWRKDGELVSPAVFVPLAEQSGLVELLGRQVLRAACAHAARWNRDQVLTLSVNLSAVQLASEDLVDQVREALADSGLSPERLVLEITETVLMEDHATVGPRLAALRALGVRIALDDFGTGYSALGYLQKIPVDIVKIDRAFVREVHLGARQGALAAAVMTLAGALELDVVAEGIELPEQAQALRGLGCRLAQGFLFSAAVPPDELDEVLRVQRNAPANRSGVSAFGS